MTDTLRKRLEEEAVSASAPCRIDMGGTLDLSTFFLPLHHLKPCTFNIALNMRTRITLSPYEKGRIRIVSKGFQPFETAAGAAPFDHSLGLMLAVAAYFQADGVSIHIDSASPPRSALGGSSAAAVALIRAFAKALYTSGHPLFEPAPVAGLAHAIEQSVAGVPCGMQDQLAAAYGGVNAWLWTGVPGEAPFYRQMPVAEDAYPRFSRQLLVAYCGQPHESKDINGTWVRDFVAGRHRDDWKRIVHYSRAFIEDLAGGRLDKAQEAMNRETELRCEMTPDVLDPVGKRLVEKAREMGCGARFTGAGGGGCVWALGNAESLADLMPAWQAIVSAHPSASLLESVVDKQGVL